MNGIFDSKVREKLLSAEVKAPAEAWEAISGRLGHTAAAPSRRYGGWWGAAGVALCGAAAALAVFVFHRDGVTRTVEPAGIDVIRTESRLACEESAFASEVKPVGEALVPREVKSPLYIEQTARAEAEVAVEPDRAPVIREEAVQQEEQWEDPFASMMAEDSESARKARREKPSVNLRGSIGANDAHSSTAFSRAQWTSGYIPEGMVENSVSNYDVPGSVGLSLMFPFSTHFSCSVGLDWTLLSRSFTGAYNTMEGEVRHYVNYVGIPVNFYYTFNPQSSFKLYAYAGASLEQCVSSKYYMFSESSLPVYKDGRQSPQIGVKAGVGICWQLGSVAIFFDPYVGYYFSESQPKSLRTEHPMMVSFDMGLRFIL